MQFTKSRSLRKETKNVMLTTERRTKNEGSSESPKIKRPFLPLSPPPPKFSAHAFVYIKNDIFKYDSQTSEPQGMLDHGFHNFV